jgi:hypothetical protein
MRPSNVIRPTGVTTKASTEPDGSLASLANAARTANVTPGLRRQLLALVAAAAAATDPAEARALTDPLSDAVDLAAGLATNTAVAFETRQEIEARLADGLALFTDVRTRDSGRARLKTLAPYRRTIARVGKIKAQNADAARLGKLFVWAQENPDDGAKVLASVEAYNRVCVRFTTREPITALPPNVKRCADGLLGQFNTARATFMSDAIEIGSGNVMAPPIKQLDDDVSEMSKALDTLMLVERSPRTLDVLLSTKSRPVNGLDKRAIAALLGVHGEGKLSPEESVAFLKASDALAIATSRIGTGWSGAVSRDAGAAWAAGRAQHLETKLKSDLTTAVSVLAGGGTVDPGSLTRFTIAADLCDFLRTVDATEAALGKLDALSNWADWSLDAGSVQAVLKPYRDATTAAVEGLIDESSAPVEQWPKVKRKYDPIVAYVTQLTAYADATGALPTGMEAAIGWFATPLDEKSFGDVRLIGYALGVWSTAEASADLTTSDQAAGVVRKALGR